MKTQLPIISLLLAFCKLTLALDEQQCQKEISEGCSNAYVATDEEVEKARIYLQERFIKHSLIKPVAEPCKKLYVRRNFKCMSHVERQRVVEVAQKLYANGFMAEIAEIHAQCWPAWHTTTEALTGHRYIALKVEQAMREIDPDITLPYWFTAEDCYKPEDSLIWKYFGTAGDEDNDYCVPDGPFTNQTEGRCIRRQWLNDKKIASWYCPELEDLVFRTKLPLHFMLFFGLGYHFHQHLNVGGYNGHMSQVYAPYDFIFFLHHNYYSECFGLRWQLTMDSFLTPHEYNIGNHNNYQTQTYSRANLTKDKVCYYNTSVLDTFHIGFGEHCSVCDRMIQFINEEIKNNTSAASKGYLSRFSLRQLFNYLPFISSLNPIAVLPQSPVEPPKCNRQCRPLPTPPKYDDTAQGRRQLQEISKVGGVHFGMIMRGSDMLIRMLNAMINKFRFCSSYVIS